MGLSKKELEVELLQGEDDEEDEEIFILENIENERNENYL